MTRARPQALLFDLDGTLVDSAPDLAGTVNDMRLQCGHEALPYALLRPHAGSGARGMLGAGLGLSPADETYAERRDEFLHLYAQRLLRLTRCFDGVAELLQQLHEAALPLAIVTNKALHLATPLVDGLLLRPPVQVLIGGDSTPHTKPHPAPLLAACAALGVAPDACVYIGDDPRDMAAARAAGMAGWAAAWGYLGPGAPPEAWGADAVLDSPTAVLKRLAWA